MKKQNNANVEATQKGITLIALIITIIVLLILAGVTINLTLGENGIFKTAQLAAKNYTNAQEKEQAYLAEFNNTLNQVHEKSEVLISLEGAVGETISIYQGENLLITSNPLNSEGKSIQNVKVPIGNLTFKGSVSEYEKTVEVTEKTTDVKVMPDGITLYWYGNECKSVTAGWTCYTFGQDGYGSAAYMRTNKIVPLKDYSNLKIQYKGTAVNVSELNCTIYPGTNNAISSSSVIRYYSRNVE